MATDINKERISLRVFSLYLFITLMLENTTLSLNIPVDGISKIVDYIFIIFCLVQICVFFKFKKQDFLASMITFFILFLIKIKSGNSSMLELLLIILMLKDIPLKKILKNIFFVQICSFLSTIVLYFVGVLPDRIVIRDGVIRNSIGFWHPNTGGVMLLSILILSFILIKNRRSQLLFTVTTDIVGGILFLYTNSRTSITLLVFATIIFLCNIIFSNWNMYIFRFKWFIPTMFTIMTLLSYYSSSLYLKGNVWIQKLNSLMTNRISLGSKFINEYGLSIFGQNVRYYSTNYSQERVVGAQYWVLDNVFLKYIINYGVAMFILLFIYFFLISFFLNKKDLVVWNSYFFIFLVLGLSEQGVFSYTFNFFMLFGVLLFKQNKNKNTLSE